ncbi:uncharacterized protein LOC129146917 isoform X2 [Talpa occidentalis]|uniref:uncharacterized protein LOC129146917 isoform X2 n=1 Tax=Talpa occidentalis TaxID=50954 RepID=UPI0023F802A0|nr:uncharacterized protein LOC129146917 isoform X2 [Talpa occidentalis]XP_054557581.1 uncharacterized protein LOC129146917 isoform X2 [Talpa occidentalis]
MGDPCRLARMEPALQRLRTASQCGAQPPVPPGEAVTPLFLNIPCSKRLSTGNIIRKEARYRNSTKENVALYHNCCELEADHHTQGRPQIHLRAPAPARRSALALGFRSSKQVTRGIVLFPAGLLSDAPPPLSQEEGEERMPLCPILSGERSAFHGTKGWKEHFSDKNSAIIGFNYHMEISKADSCLPSHPHEVRQMQLFLPWRNVLLRICGMFHPEVGILPNAENQEAWSLLPIGSM